MTLETIVGSVARHYGLSVAALKSKSRQKQIDYARNMFYYLACKNTDHSTILIGQFLKGRSHCAVLNGKKRIDGFLKFYRDVSQDIAAIEKTYFDLTLIPSDVDLLAIATN